MIHTNNQLHKTALYLAVAFAAFSVIAEEKENLSGSFSVTIQQNMLKMASSNKQDSVTRTGTLVPATLSYDGSLMALVAKFDCSNPFAYVTGNFHLLGNIPKDCEWDYKSKLAFETKLYEGGLAVGRPGRGNSRVEIPHPLPPETTGDIPDIQGLGGSVEVQEVLPDTPELEEFKALFDKSHEFTFTSNHYWLAGNFESGLVNSQNINGWSDIYGGTGKTEGHVSITYKFCVLGIDEWKCTRLMKAFGYPNGDIQQALKIYDVHELAETLAWYAKLLNLRSSWKPTPQEAEHVSIICWYRWYNAVHKIAHNLTDLFAPDDTTYDGSSDADFITGGPLPYGTCGDVMDYKYKERYKEFHAKDKTRKARITIQGIHSLYRLGFDHAAPVLVPKDKKLIGYLKRDRNNPEGGVITDNGGSLLVMDSRPPYLVPLRTWLKNHASASKLVTTHSYYSDSGVPLKPSRGKGNTHRSQRKIVLDLDPIIVKRYKEIYDKQGIPVK